MAEVGTRGLPDPSTALADVEAALYQHAARDPVALAHLAGITPDPWQSDLLRSTDRQVCVCCSRQVGKSTTTAILALHTALFRPRALILIVSRSRDQAAELYVKLSGYYTVLAQTLGALIPSQTTSTQTDMELANGSRVVCLPGTEASVRGYSRPALVVVDEAARVLDETYQALRPMLAKGRCRLVLLSTPFCQRGFFWTVWDAGGRQWRRISITAEQSPQVDPNWLAHERETLDPWWYQQEYQNVFHAAVDVAFPQAQIDAMLGDPTVEAWEFGGASG